MSLTGFPNFRSDEVVVRCRRGLQRVGDILYRLTRIITCWWYMLQNSW